MSFDMKTSYTQSMQRSIQRSCHYAFCPHFSSLSINNSISLLPVLGLSVIVRLAL